MKISGSIDKAIQLRNKWFKENGIVDEERIELYLNDGYETQYQYFSCLKMAMGLTGLVLDLFLLNQIEAFEAFFFAIDEASQESLAYKLRWVDLITDKIKKLVLGSGIKASKTFLEMRIQEEFRLVTKVGTDFDLLKGLLNPEPFDFYSFKRTDLKRWEELDSGDEQYHQRILGVTQYHRRIIQRLPWAQHFLREKILEEEKRIEISRKQATAKFF